MTNNASSSNTACWSHSCPHTNNTEDNTLTHRHVQNAQNTQRPPALLYHLLWQLSLSFSCFLPASITPRNQKWVGIEIIWESKAQMAHESVLCVQVNRAAAPLRNTWDQVSELSPRKHGRALCLKSIFCLSHLNPQGQWQSVDPRGGGVGVYHGNEALMICLRVSRLSFTGLSAEQLTGLEVYLWQTEHVAQWDHYKKTTVTWGVIIKNTYFLWIAFFKSLHFCWNGHAKK